MIYFNTANYLDSKKLLKKYRTLLLERLKAINTEKKLHHYLNLVQGLPEEMQIPLSQKICAEAKSIFKILPESIIKRVWEREYNGKIIISPDVKTMIIKAKNLTMLVIDIATNLLLWKKPYIFGNLLFSSDSSKILLYHELPSPITIFDVKNGELLKTTNSFDFPTVRPLRFFSDVNRIVMEDRKSGKIMVLYKMLALATWYLKNHFQKEAKLPKIVITIQIQKH